MLRIIGILSLLLFNSGCAVVAVGAAGIAASTTAEDPRTTGTQLDDLTASNRINGKLADIEGLSEQANIRVEVYNGQALVVGQVTTAAFNSAIKAALQGDEHITKVHYQVRQTELVSTTQAAKDIWIANRIRAQLLTDKETNVLLMNVIVENGEVFLMGLVDNQMATKAVEIARNTSGVERVVRAFEIRAQ